MNLTLHSVGAAMLLTITGYFSPGLRQQNCDNGQCWQQQPMVQYVYAPPTQGYGNQFYAQQGSFLLPPTTSQVVQQRVTTQEVVTQAAQPTTAATVKITEYVPQETVENVEREVTRMVPETTTEIVPVRKVEYVPQIREVPLTTVGWNPGGSAFTYGGSTGQSSAVVEQSTGFSPLFSAPEQQGYEYASYSESYSSAGQSMMSSSNSSPWSLGQGWRNMRQARLSRRLSRVQARSYGGCR